MAIPKSFNAQGTLDPGTYDATLVQIEHSLLVTGNGSSATWDSAWRKKLIENAAIMIDQLWKVGVDDIFLDGSFVEDKNHPNDIDGYFDPHLSMYSQADMSKFEKLVSDLNDLDPHKLWDWSPDSRRAHPGFAKKQLPMWLAYRVELFPHLDQGTGIKDAQGNDLQFPSAFRQSRHNYSPKGIVKVIR